MSLSELRPLVRLAGPVVLAEIGWMSMGLVDTLMVGPLGPAAIGATGLGSGVFTAFVIFGMGLMLGLDALVSSAAGAGRRDECVVWLHQGVILACAVAPLVMIGTWLAYVSLDAWGLNPEIRVLVGPYLLVSTVGALPLLLYAAFRRYLQGIHVVGPILFALISANAVNAAANAILVYGRFGVPALGVTGSAWATFTARVYMAGCLYLAIRRQHQAARDRQTHVRFAFDRVRLRRLVALGAPAALQVTLEVGVFAVATALAGRLDAVATASHQIALNLASVVFMVPLGLASAGAVRVGHAVGAQDLPRARRAGWTALVLGAVVMTLLGLILFLFPRVMLGVFTTDPRVLAIGATLLTIAAAFQLFDGTQAVATGVLRGIGDTRTPMVVNVIGHWFLGLPVGYALCFTFNRGVVGLWIGLSLGLIFCALVLTAVWIRRTRHLPLGAHLLEVPDLI